MSYFEAQITFRFKASSPLVAELYVDGLCTAMRYNKPEIVEKTVQWGVQQVQDDFAQLEREHAEQMPAAPDTERAERERLQLPPPGPDYTTDEDGGNPTDAHTGEPIDP